MKTLIGILLVLTGLAAAVGFYYQGHELEVRHLVHLGYSPEQLQSQNRPAVVKVQIHRGEKVFTGTGFYLGETGLIATDWHVLSPLNDNLLSGDLEIVDADGTVTTEVLVGDCKEIPVDICFLKVTTPPKLGLTVNPTIPSKEESIFALGSSESPIQQGHLVSTQALTDPELTITELALEFPANPKNSGAPILDQFGQVIGMVSYREQGTAAGVSANALEYFAKKIEFIKPSELVKRVAEDNKAEVREQVGHILSGAFEALQKDPTGLQSLNESSLASVNLMKMSIGTRTLDFNFAFPKIFNQVPEKKDGLYELDLKTVPDQEGEAVFRFMYKEFSSVEDLEKYWIELTKGLPLRWQDGRLWKVDQQASHGVAQDCKPSVEKRVQGYFRCDADLVLGDEKGYTHRRVLAFTKLNTMFVARVDSTDFFSFEEFDSKLLDIVALTANATSLKVIQKAPKPLSKKGQKGRPVSSKSKKKGPLKKKPKRQTSDD